MVCSYFDDHLAEILSHNHSADLNTTESYQMESSKAHSVSEENINATSSGSFQSQFPSPQLLSNMKLLKSVFTLPTTSASLGHWHLHQPTCHIWKKIITFAKILAYYKTSSSFCHTEAEQIYRRLIKKTSQKTDCLLSATLHECVTVQLPAVYVQIQLTALSPPC